MKAEVADANKPADNESETALEASSSSEFERLEEKITALDRHLFVQNAQLDRRMKEMRSEIRAELKVIKFLLVVIVLILIWPLIMK